MTHIRFLRACKGNKNPLIGKEKVIWALLALILFLISECNDVVERYYASGVYPYISVALRFITGFIPFSVGDFFYLLILVYFIIKLFLWLKCLKKHSTDNFFAVIFVSIITGLLKLYVVFMVLWGLNYNRSSIDKQLQLAPHNYDTASISLITNELIDTVNSIRRKLPSDKLPVYDRSVIVKEAVHCYSTASLTNKNFNYRLPAVKQTVFTPLADYAGFLGYYNPFSGEAQLRTDIPNVMIPYIACHEMAHQLGYAGEDQANFVGYLVCRVSNDPFFRYSVYLDLLNYALAEQYRLYGTHTNFKRFEMVIQENRQRMDTLVKLDRKLIRQFFDKRRNNVAPIVSTLYDQYLRMNKQFAGICSYDLVVKWLIAYKAKYGKI